MRNDWNHRRRYIGAWLVLAVAFLTAGFLKLSQIEFEPLAPSPAGVSQLRLHLSLYDELLSARRMDSEARLDLPIVNARLPHPRAAPPAAAPERADGKSPTLPPPPLPQLTGILQVVHATGRPQYYAVLNGNVMAEKDTIAGLRIEQISAAGVVLSQRSQRWVLPAPEVHFSISQRP